VLDWEMATVGPPEVDLGWMVFFHSFFQEMAALAGTPGIPGMFARDHAVEAYESLAGHELLDLGWFEALAALRFGIIVIRTTMRSVAYGLQEPPSEPDDAIIFLPLMRRLLAEL